MKLRSLALAATAALLLGSAAQAAEIKVLATNALKSTLEDLGPKFEKQSGNTIVFTWGTAAELTPKIAGGTAVDVAFVTDANVADLVKQGKLASGTPIARSGIAVAIKKGAPKPVLANADDFKKMLLSAKSIAWVEKGASGIYLKGQFEKLGVMDEIKGKLKSVEAAGKSVAEGEAEIGFTQVAEILPYPGAEVGGALPPDVQSFTSFSVGVQNKDNKAAEALVAFLKSPESTAVIKAKGLEPR